MDRIEAHLTGGAAPLPVRLLELAVVAAELAEALGARRLTPTERSRILARATVLASGHSRHGRLGPLRRPPMPALTFAAVGGAVALVLAAAGLSRRRRMHAQAPITVLGRAA